MRCVHLNRLTLLPDKISAEVAVIGSGPGGSITACLLAEAGRNVVLLEEGPHLELQSCPPFSRQEMEQKYRAGGLTVAFGRTKVAYVEGCCVGGGSEINSSLYHRTPADVLDGWRSRFQILELSEPDMLPYFEANEKELSVSTLREPPPPASVRLHDGATRLGWQSAEVPRLFAYAPDRHGDLRGTKQSMSQTFVPRGLAAGLHLLPNTRARRLRRCGARWEVLTESVTPGATSNPLTVETGAVFVACGAIQTPALLQRSGLGRRAGATLHLHPTIKVVAQFREAVNELDMGVPVHQVKEFAPRYTLGCSISSPPHLALALLDHPSMIATVADDWQRMAVYYAMTRGGAGRVRSIPGLRAPLVTYRLAPEDYAELGQALRKLCECLLAGGAVAIYPGLPGSPVVKSTSDLERLPDSLSPKATNLMTIHLFSSCPMGEAASCVTDSFGRVRGAPGVWVADASLLPGPPGVNPQGTIMALVRRNVFKFLGEKRQ